MLTDLQIAKLKWRADRYKLPVHGGPGLYLAVFPRGRRTWQLRVNIFTKPVLLTLGYWPEMTVKAALAKARLFNQMIARGEDPRESSAADARARVTVNAFARRWLRDVVAKARKDVTPIERRLERDILPAIGRMKLREVSLADVRSIVFERRDAGRDAAAVGLRDLLLRLFNYARTCGLVDVNPAAALERKYIARLRSRTRALSEAEMKPFYQTLKSPRLGMRVSIALDLLLLTLARKSELLNARWKHVDLSQGTWEVPAELSKSGRPHVVYLSNAALRHFLALNNSYWMRDGSKIRPGYTPGSEWFIFPHRNSNTQPMAPNLLNKAIKRVDWGMPAFTPHDLRRTAVTHLNEKGYSADVIEKAANHAVRGGIRGVYNRAQYAAERKKMLEEWAEYLEGLK